MVRRPEWAPANQLAQRHRSRDGRHDRGDASLFVAEWRQQAGHRSRQEGLARTGWTDHGHAVAPSEGQFEGTPGLQLAAHFGQIGHVLGLDGVVRSKFGGQVGLPAEPAG